MRWSGKNIEKISIENCIGKDFAYRITLVAGVGEINEVVRRMNRYFLSELITESTPTVPMNGMADG